MLTQDRARFFREFEPQLAQYGCSLECWAL
jgi:hypothetical protein